MGPRFLKTLLAGRVKPMRAGPLTARGEEYAVARRLAQLRVPAAFHGFVDNDGFAPLNLGELKADAPAALQVTFHAAQGANICALPIDSRLLSTQVLGRADIFVASVSSDEQFLRECFRRLHTIGNCLTVLLATDWARATPAARELPDIVVLDEEGLAGGGRIAPPALDEFLLREQTVLVRRRNGSATLVDSRGRMHVPGYGGGSPDGFAAGLIAHLAAGGSIDLSVRFGNKVSRLLADRAATPTYREALTAKLPEPRLARAQR